jgi:hypothetical protein
MLRSAVMKMRPSCSSASQLGSQLWLIQRDELPPNFRVDHAVFIDMKVKRVVGLQRIVRVAVLRLLPADDLAGVFNEHSPSAISCTANTPLPCTPERRVWMRRPAEAGWAVAGRHGKTLLLEYAHLRVRVYARRNPIVEALGPTVARWHQQKHSMSKTLVIAEKPSVAQDIVRALTPVAGKFDKHDEHFENEQYVVTSAVGHLVEIQAPEEFDVKRGKWSFANLPVIPPYFDLKPVDKTKTRLNAVVKQAKRKDVTPSSTPATRAARAS